MLESRATRCSWMTLKLLDFLWTTTGKHFALIGTLGPRRPPPPLALLYLVSFAPLISSNTSTSSALEMTHWSICFGSPSSLCLLIIWRRSSTRRQSVQRGLDRALVCHFPSPQGYCCYVILVLSHVHVRVLPTFHVSCCSLTITDHSADTASFFFLVTLLLLQRNHIPAVLL